MAPALSVVMPNYNHGRFIEEALAAIEAQSRRPDELIIVDDASTDDSRERIRRFAASRPWVQPVFLERNGGFVRAQNEGFRRSRGEHLFFTAADDRVRPGLFEKSLAQFAAHPSAGLVSSLAVLIGEDGRDLGPLESPLISAGPVYVPAERVPRLYAEYGNWLVTYTVVYRRAVLEELGGFDPAQGANCDGLACLYSICKYGCVFIPEPLASWRRMPAGVAEKEGSDLARAFEIIDGLDRELTSGPRASTFPRTVVEMMLRQNLLLLMDRTLSQERWAAAGVARAIARLPRRTALDSAYGALLRAAPALARPLLKLYMALRQPPAARRRLFARKAGVA